MKLHEDMVADLSRELEKSKAEKAEVQAQLSANQKQVTELQVRERWATGTSRRRGRNIDQGDEPSDGTRSGAARPRNYHRTTIDIEVEWDDYTRAVRLAGLRDARGSWHD